MIQFAMLDSNQRLCFERNQQLEQVDGLPRDFFYAGVPGFWVIFCFCVSYSYDTFYRDELYLMFGDICVSENYFSITLFNNILVVNLTISFTYSF